VERELPHAPRPAAGYNLRGRIVAMVSLPVLGMMTLGAVAGVVGER